MDVYIDQGKSRCGVCGHGVIDTQVVGAKAVEVDDYADSSCFLGAKHHPECFTYIVSFNSLKKFF